MSGNLNGRELEHYDVVIVGAGPAGANLARLIDTEKYRVLIVDGSEGREKVCGGLISPDAQNVLARYDLSLPGNVLVSPQLFSVRTIDLSNGLTRYYRRNYINVDRDALDGFFRSLIPNDVELVRARCEAVSRLDGGYSLELSGGRRLECAYLVGADGASSVIRRELFKNKKIQKYVAIQQWFEAGQVNPNYSCIFDNATSSGCSWVFFKDGMMIFGGAFDKENCRDAFEAQKTKLEVLGAVEKGAFDEPKRTEACLVSRPKLSGGIFRGANGVFFIGEAAGFISPSSFEGISYALLSAEALAEAFNSRRGSRSVLFAYKRRSASLAAKVKIKCLKRPFMYNKLLRRLVMKSGLSAIKLKKR